MSFLQNKCQFGFFTREKAVHCKPFRCGDDDLDEFFLQDAFLQSDELLCKNYCFTLDDNPTTIVAAFTLANDSIKKIPGSRKKKVEKKIPREKLYSSYPAVMIGRLGISADFQGQHLGSDVLSFIKAWFVDPLNKTGCRFLLVDSYNKPNNLSFYQRNGFNYLFSTEEQEREFRGIKPEHALNSRLMYFDLIELVEKKSQ
ncbi:MAG: GNAT family N-acetyltransferase [Clostridia bacterium]|nr:GNAT family N-acetyltransferase [Clostridia bacterium]